MSFFSRLKEAAGFSGPEPVREFSEALDRELRKLASGEDVMPPWEFFPGKGPVHGWNQGFPEEWRTEVWDPFWRGLGQAERSAYLERNPPPDEDWHETLFTYWDQKKENP
jgi:hypothetical protein